MKIVADDKIPFLKGVFEPFAEIDYLPGDQIDPSSLKNADVLLTRSITICNEDLLKNSSVTFIATATIGDDHIDKQFCQANDIRWSSAKGCNAGAVEQYVTAALLEIAAKVKIDLAGKTIGIIGVGVIGSRVARVAELLGMKTLLNDPPRAKAEGAEGFAGLTEIQQNADFITLHVPLTFGGEHKTFHLLNEEFFEGLVKPVVLINTSRGAVLDSDVLKLAVRNEKIKRLVIDVWENEPHIDSELLEITEIATPHIAGYSIEGKANATAMTVQSVGRIYGLGLDAWYPEIPADPQKIDLECNDMPVQEIYSMVFNAVYPIHLDSVTLKASPEHFADLRGNYVFRHENSAWELTMHHADEKVKSTLRSFGFQVNQ
ncbi:MAG: 4-phosphoerythronate dehydrogenase [Bacteroidales bacterium]|nr:4-phosphoerythronate dehydrogenase [Bacteroidales bacterium]